MHSRSSPKDPMSSPWSPDGHALSIHLDLVGGIAGDMFTAAMVDALPFLEPIVMEALAAVRPGTAPMPAFPRAHSAGIASRRFGFPAKYSVSDKYEAPRGTSYLDLRRTVAGAALDDATRTHALALPARSRARA